ncbi:MAG: AP2 domain-containing protein [Planctomycetota bacterium]
MKNAPAVDLDTGGALWPVVTADELCGCFRYCDGDHIDEDPRGSGLPIYRDSFGDYCRIPLTRGLYVKVDPGDYIWLSQFRWHCHKSERTYYAVRTLWQAGKSKKIMMHRLVAGTPSHLVCDHINRCGLDNRSRNLRNCTRRQNTLNQAGHCDSASRYKGVYWKKDVRKWAATIKAEGKRRHLGYFDGESDAAKAYDEAASRLHGEFAALNFP